MRAGAIDATGRPRAREIVLDVGFIGVGSMGAAMVPHLVAAGHRVSVWNRDAAKAEALDGVTERMAVVERLPSDDATVAGLAQVAGDGPSLDRNALGDQLGDDR